MAGLKEDQPQPLGTAGGQLSWVLLASLCVLMTTGMVCPRHAVEVPMAMARCITASGRAWTISIVIAHRQVSDLNPPRGHGKFL